MKSLNCMAQQVRQSNQKDFHSWNGTFFLQTWLTAAGKILQITTYPIVCIPPLSNSVSGVIPVCISNSLDIVCDLNRTVIKMFWNLSCLMGNEWFHLLCRTRSRFCYTMNLESLSVRTVNGILSLPDIYLTDHYQVGRRHDFWRWLYTGSFRKCQHGPQSDYHYWSLVVPVTY